MNKKLWSLFFLLITFPVTQLFSAVLELPLTEKNKSLFYLDKSQLAPNGVFITSVDDLLDSSDQKNLIVVTFEKMEPGFHKITLVEDAAAQKKSGFFLDKKSYVEIPSNRSFKDGLAIDFWSKPLSTLRGKVISIQYLSMEGLKKEISVSFEKGRMKVQFQNMFSDSTERKTSKTLTLLSNTEILPSQWSHHKILFTPSNGRLAYYNNGKLDSETWATRSFLPGSSILFFNIPDHQRILVGENYRGLLDQLIIGNSPTTQFPETQIGYQDANIYTRTISLPTRSTINAIHVDGILPQDTALVTHYRVAETPFNDNTPEEIIPWHEYNDLYPQKNPQTIGQYIQIRLHLLADPTRNYSPLLKKILVHYTPFDIPLKPLDFRAYSSNGNLLLSLRQNTNESITAYKVYIGTQPDSFFGDPENGIQSPMIIPITNFNREESTKRLSYRISGLTPMKLYYMKITAVTTDGMESTFSEVAKCRIRALE